MTIGEKIRIRRTALGMTQAEFAARLCKSADAIQKWETGHNVPQTVDLLLISDLLGIDLNTLLDNEIDIQQ